MRYHVLATDYDGTLAHHGRVHDSTLAALERLRATGRRLILVTGRELDDLLSVFAEVEFFEWIVAENGALLYRPADRQEKVLGAPPPEFVEMLRQRGVAPLSVGRVIVATWQPHETTILRVIRDLGLELQVSFNKGAVMVLPAGITKASGLAGRPGRDAVFAARGGRRRRRGERPRLPQPGRVRGRGRQAGGAGGAGRSGPAAT
jgi:HAD superfamily hydrolase (TIGR01484 family)